MSSSKWRPIIGLEVHVELKTRSKMFCSCPNRHFHEKPNSNICPVCLGLPGALPVPNKEAIRQTIAIALALNCKINRYFWFDRKNYFYPDLPKGYQISQHFRPIGIKGKVPILQEGKWKEIAIKEVHLEEDTGKLLHQNEATLIDFNRSGVPLVEIVSEPTISSSLEAKLYLKRLRQTIRWLGFSDCDMEKGSMRLEANISVAPAKSKSLPSWKVEIKNLNSFRFIEWAINYEIERQIALLNQGQQPNQETRGFDPERKITFPQRIKETAKDYRYFPEPDIPPFEIRKKEIEAIKKGLPRLPWEVEKQIIAAGIPWQWAQILTQERKRAEWFLETLKVAKKDGISPKELANFVVNKKVKLTSNPQEVVREIKNQTERYSLSEQEIEKAALWVLQNNPKAMADFYQGKQNVISFLIGQLVRKTEGRADPRKAAQILTKLLTKTKNGQKKS